MLESYHKEKACRYQRRGKSDLLLCVDRHCVETVVKKKYLRIKIVYNRQRRRATLLHFVTVSVCDVIILSSISVYRQYNFVKGLVQERSGSNSGKKGKRARFIYLTLRRSASR